MVKHEDPKPTPEKMEPKPETKPTEQVVVAGRPLVPPVETTVMGSSRAVHDKMREDLAAGRAEMRKPGTTVNTADAKTLPSVGQPRAQTSEEIREDAESGAGSGKVTQAGPYPGNPQEAQVRAILASERKMMGDEYRTDDITGTSVDGAGVKDTIVVRLLYDWWDGCGERHPLNSLVEVPLNEARNLIDQRKAERTDPLR